jgi:hypothetical protein
MSLVVVPRRVGPGSEDTWRWYCDFFYDPNMHGRRWAIGAAYRHGRSYFASTELALSQMVGESCLAPSSLRGHRPARPTKAYTDGSGDLAARAAVPVRLRPASSGLTGDLTAACAA